MGQHDDEPVSAITGATTDLILDDPRPAEFCSAVMREAKAIGEQIGIPIAQSPDERHAVTRKLAMKTSMLQDVEAGRSIELCAGGRWSKSRQSWCADALHRRAVRLWRGSWRVRGLY